MTGELSLTERISVDSKNVTLIAFTSYARNSQKKQYLIFEEMRNNF